MEELSNCCKAPVKVMGDITHYYQCTNCLKACDLYKSIYDIIGNDDSTKRRNTITKMIIESEKLKTKPIF